MVSVTQTTTGGWLPRGRPLVVEDLDAAPDDGHRYELLDGVLIVSPSPVTRHQSAVVELAYRLRGACPADLKVLVAPYDVRLADDTVLQPDVLVARRSDLTAENLPAAPALAVEVLSPSTRGVDLLLKRERLERAGCASYWVVDPGDADVPAEARLLALDLVDGRFATVAEVSGAQTWTSTHPYPVTVTPRDLVV